MNKNPFSFYDFLGYLFPGLVAMMLLTYCVIQGVSSPIEQYFSITTFTNMFSENPNMKWWESTVVIIVLAYISGHVIAYLSSTSVEYFANRIFGYPSYYLLHPEEDKRILFSKYFMYENKKNYSHLNIFMRLIHTIFNRLKMFVDGKFIWRLFVSFMLFPISVIFLPLNKKISIVKFVTRPLDRYVRNSIFTKITALSEKLNISRPDVNSRADYHRIIMHYVYLNIPQCQRKTDNYIAIYGFLRAITLITCLFFDYLFVIQLLTIYEYWATDISYGCFNWKVLWILMGMLAFCNVLFMGFIKFYRRFTLENYMSLLAGSTNQ